MATRARESNRLYVDTAYDPDTATRHDGPGQMEPLDLLRSVIETSGADVSASEARDREKVTSHSPWRIASQGAAAIDVRPVAREPAQRI